MSAKLTTKTQQMTEEKFKQIKNVRDSIEDKQRKLRSIDLLMRSCALSCKITGTPPNSFHTLQHSFSGTDEIIRLLQIDKEKLVNELDELHKLFSEQ